mgnify:CR=1 FL=1
MIPWHLGTVACHTDGYWILGDDLYRTTEAEANRFASEFLLPAVWLREVVAGAGSLRETLATVASARVSPLASAFALTQVLPPGYLFVVVDGDGRVSRHDTSEGTAVNYPRSGPFDVSSYRGIAAEHQRAMSGTEELHWFRFETARSLLKVVADSDSRAILRKLLADVHDDDDDRVRASRAINGVIGAANSMYEGSTAEELYAICMQRFASRSPLVADCVRHTDFQLFLATKAEEIVERRP